MDDALIERLTTMYSHRGDGIPTQYVNPDGPEAAERIAALKAGIAAMVASIRRNTPPFAVVIAHGLIGEADHADR